MKVSSKTNIPRFTPFEITILVETEQELSQLLCAANSPISTLRNNKPTNLKIEPTERLCALFVILDTYAHKFGTYGD